MKTCAKCGEAVEIYFYCDRTAGGPWCPPCFRPATGDCIANHAEDCGTKVIDTAVGENPAVPESAA